MSTNHPAEDPLILSTLRESAKTGIIHGLHHRPLPQASRGKLSLHKTHPPVPTHSLADVHGVRAR